MSAILNDLAELLNLEGHERSRIVIAKPPITSVSIGCETINEGAVPLEGRGSISPAAGRSLLEREPLVSRPDTWLCTSFNPRWSRRGVTEEANAWGAGLRSDNVSESILARRVSFNVCPSKVRPRAPVSSVRSRSVGVPRAPSNSKHARLPWLTIIKSRGSLVSGNSFTAVESESVECPTPSPAAHSHPSLDDRSQIEGACGHSRRSPPAVDVPFIESAVSLQQPQNRTRPLPVPSLMKCMNQHCLIDPLPPITYIAIAPVAEKDPMGAVLVRANASLLTTSSSFSDVQMLLPPNLCAPHVACNVPAVRSCTELHNVFAAQRLLSLSPLIELAVLPAPKSTKLMQLQEAWLLVSSLVRTVRHRTLAAVKAISRHYVAENNALIERAERWIQLRKVQCFIACAKSSAVLGQSRRQPIEADSMYRSAVLGEVIRKGQMHLALLKWRARINASTILMHLLKIRDTTVACYSIKATFVLVQLEKEKERIADLESDNVTREKNKMKSRNAVTHWATISRICVEIRARQRVLTTAHRAWTLDTAWRSLFAGSIARQACNELNEVADKLRTITVLARCFAYMFMLARRLRSMRSGVGSNYSGDVVVRKLPSAQVSSSIKSAGFDPELSSEDDDQTSSIVAEFRNLRRRYGTRREATARIKGPAEYVQKLAYSLCRSSVYSEWLRPSQHAVLEISQCIPRSAEHLSVLVLCFSRQCVRKVISSVSVLSSLSRARNLCNKVVVMMGSAHPANGTTQWSDVLTNSVADEIETSEQRHNSTSALIRFYSGTTLRPTDLDWHRINRTCRQDDLSERPREIVPLDLFRYCKDDVEAPTNVATEIPVYHSRSRRVADIIFDAAARLIVQKCNSKCLLTAFRTWNRALFLHRVDSNMQLVWRRHRAQRVMLMLAQHVKYASDWFIRAVNALKCLRLKRLFHAWRATMSGVIALREEKAFFLSEKMNKKALLVHFTCWLALHRKCELLYIRATAHWSLTGLRNALLAWRTFCSIRRPHRHAIAKINASCSFRVLLVAWRQWRQRFPARCLVRRVLTAAVQARVIILREAPQLNTRYVAAVQFIRIWLDAALNRRTIIFRRHLAHVAEAHAKVSAVSKAFGAWSSYHQASRAAVRVMQLCKDRLILSSLIKWKETAKFLITSEDAMKKSARLRLLRRSLSSLRQLTRVCHLGHLRSQKSAFRCLKLYVAMRRERQAELCVHAIRVCSRAFLGRWLRFTRDRMRIISVSLLIRERIARSSLAMVLLAWQHAWTVRRYERVCSERAVSSWLPTQRSRCSEINSVDCVGPQLSTPLALTHSSQRGCHTTHVGGKIQQSSEIFLAELPPEGLTTPSHPFDTEHNANHLFLSSGTAPIVNAEAVLADISPHSFHSLRCELSSSAVIPDTESSRPLNSTRVAGSGLERGSAQLSAESLSSGPEVRVRETCGLVRRDTPMAAVIDNVITVDNQSSLQGIKARIFSAVLKHAAPQFMSQIPDSVSFTCFDIPSNSSEPRDQHTPKPHYTIGSPPRAGVDFSPAGRLESPGELRAMTLSRG